MEEKLFSPKGQLRTVGPSTYKIPSFRDIPEVFNVALLRDSPNPLAIHSSKAVGEPALFLGSSVFFAIRHAISFARFVVCFQMVLLEFFSAELGKPLEEVFRLDSPATIERIALLSQDVCSCLFGDCQSADPPHRGPRTREMESRSVSMSSNVILSTAFTLQKLANQDYPF